MQQTQMHSPPVKKVDATRAAKQQPPQNAQPKDKRKKWLPYIAFGGLLAAGLSMVGCLVTMVLVLVLTSSRIPSNVSVNGLDIGGRTAQDAQAALEQAFASRTVTIADNDRTQVISLSDLGITFNAEATVKQAKEAPAGANINPVYHVDLVKAQNTLISLSEGFNVEPTTELPGRAIDIPVVLERLRSNAAEELADGVLDLVMLDVAPLEPEELTLENYNGPTTIHVVEPGEELGLISKRYDVSIAEIVALNGITDPDLLYVGQELIIPAAGEYVPSAAEAPPPSTNTGRAIVVSVGNQRIYAYENGQLVRSHLVSTGLPKTPTVLGDYSVYVKYLADDMSGPDYFLPQVPYTMYFYAGYAIHGTYWHNAFGRVMSHGCVNLPVDEAEWFYNFASVGTPVRVVA
jgi:lipoprotein-anchoring transpeptidase ErfK/SrfK